MQRFLGDIQGCTSKIKSDTREGETAIKIRKNHFQVRSSTELKATKKRGTLQIQQLWLILLMCWCEVGRDCRVAQKTPLFLRGFFLQIPEILSDLAGLKKISARVGVRISLKGLERALSVVRKVRINWGYVMRSADAIKC